MDIWVVVLIEIREELLSRGLTMIGEVWLEEEVGELEVYGVFKGSAIVKDKELNLWKFYRGSDTMKGFRE